MPRLHFVTRGTTIKKINGVWVQVPSIATIGTFQPLRLDDIRRYVLSYPIAWITA